MGLAGYGCSGASDRRQHELLQRGRGRREADASHGDGGNDGGGEWASGAWRARARVDGGPAMGAEGRGRRGESGGSGCRTAAMRSPAGGLLQP